jgi:hypothetical protein
MVIEAEEYTSHARPGKIMIYFPARYRDKYS